MRAISLADKELILTNSSTIAVGEMAGSAKAKTEYEAAAQSVRENTSRLRVDWPNRSHFGAFGREQADHFG